MTFAADLKEFIDNDKIIDFERRSNEAYTDLIHRIGKETADMLSKEGLIRKTINDINSDFVERNFAGVIKSIALQIVPSGNRIMQHFVTIKEFCDRNQPGALGMFSLFGQEEPCGTESAGGKFIAVAGERTGTEQGKGTDAF